MFKLTEEFIIQNWEKDWYQDAYFTHTNDGDSIGYCLQSETFSLNNYWNHIGQEAAEIMLNTKGDS
ncbi:hypothetical protein FZW96_12145 [Bacillus sp. BGMRC 2118]|nr:hypothetical protein FZW96_12145 [Bacillus sp. BGMRC 2118]